MSGGDDDDEINAGRRQRHRLRRRRQRHRSSPAPATTASAAATATTTSTAQAGNDKLYGDAGDDCIDGGSGDDCVSGGDGDDQLLGGVGNDKVFGGDGHDGLDGGVGNDKLSGGLGNDYLIGGAGNDELCGGGGADLFIFREDEGDSDFDLIKDWNSGDKIGLCGQTIRDFNVAKIEFVNLEVSTSNFEDDVLITLNDNTQIGVLNASFDFSEGVSDPLAKFYVEKFGKNVDDFVRYTDKTCPEVELRGLRASRVPRSSDRDLRS